MLVELGSRINLRLKALKAFKMRSRTRSQQATFNSASGGLPVCLCGIGVHPRMQASNRQHQNHHSHHQNVRARQSSTQNSFTESEIASSLEESIDAALDQRLHEMSLSEGPARDDNLQERPRLALALEMADLDRRREAIRKHRVNRGLLNFVEDRRTLVDRNSGRLHTVIHAVMQDPSFQYEFERGLQYHSCAKAA